MESPPLFLIVMGLFLSVNELMLNELRAMAKGLPTRLTFVGFLTCMDSIMHSKVRDPFESPTTPYTGRVSLQCEFSGVA